MQTSKKNHSIYEGLACIGNSKIKLDTLIPKISLGNSFQINSKKQILTYCRLKKIDLKDFRNICVSYILSNN